ncbi:putative alkyltransferase-like protein 1 [[Candida] jaroonii]|uniref:Alkyltransferase-like protein 1 n=1 Tax=[Candida] jaroonii TaxID=467808 RepID=A0ACA9Y1I8_9ASCO|nr:putative alkyltransferase-like protein 1 [[Candida] jaroonii]
MNLTDEAKSFYYSVYSVVSQIPYGSATSYGHIAYLVGKPKNSRQVGSAMKNYFMILPALLASGNAEDNDAGFQNIMDIPWWRVVGSSGKISPRSDSNGEILQQQRLVEEGTLQQGTIVDLDEFGWFPDEVDID